MNGDLFWLYYKEVQKYSFIVHTELVHLKAENLFQICMVEKVKLRSVKITKLISMLAVEWNELSLFNPGMNTVDLCHFHIIDMIISSLFIIYVAYFFLQKRKSNKALYK